MISPCVIMRSHNDMPVIVETLAKLETQTHPFELICLDNDSSDGTRREVGRYAAKIISIHEGEYIPGRALNMAMEASSSEIVVFLNSDCTPLDQNWLGHLLAGFDSEKVAAAFGRQIPRADCKPLFRKDTEQTYGDGSRQKHWRHCFSMASSAIRRSVWEEMRFNEHLRYSEDIEWTWRARQLGYLIRYVPSSVVTHSHNYSLKQFYQRQYGEGRAEAVIFSWNRWERSFLRYSFLPYARQVASDLHYGLTHQCLIDTLYSPILRMTQLIGRRRGFLQGFKETSR